MIQKMFLTLALGALVFTASCGSNRIKPTSDNAVVALSGLLEMQVIWIKDKGDKFDIELKLFNENEKSILIRLDEMSCARGGTRGELKHTFYNTGERTIDFRPGQTKTLKLVCRYNTEAKGPFGISIRRVLLDSDGNGKLDTWKEVVLGKDLNWSHSDGSKRVN